MKKVSRILRSGYFFIRVCSTITRKVRQGGSAKCAKKLSQQRFTSPFSLQSLHKPGDSRIFPGHKRAILDMGFGLPDQPQIERQVL